MFVRSLLVTLILFSFQFVLLGQDKPEREDPEIYSPDIPGNIVVDLGFNWLSDKPETMNTNWWGSKGVGLFYKYHIMMGKSKFSFRPGFGLGLDRYSFERRVNVARITDTDRTDMIEIIGLDSLALFDNFIPDIKKSKLVTDYLEIPLELGWHLSRNDPERGFRILVGGKIGWLFDSKIKVNYKQSGFRKILKVKEDYKLNPWRYSGTARIGISFLEVFGEYSFSNLFKKDQGPEGTSVTRYWKIGLSFVGF